MHPQPLFKIGGLGIYPYGLCMALGLVACFVFLWFTMRYKKFNDDSIDAIIIIGIVGTGLGILSAMLFQSVYNYIDNGVFSFGEGMTFIGGLIGGVISFLGIWWLYVYVIAPRTKIKFLQNNMNAGLTDALPFIPVAVTIAHAFGRLGCFFGGCCYGKATDAWYGMYCAQTYYPSTGTVITGDKVIPTQLFEMAFLILLCAVMCLLYFKFKFNYNFAVYSVVYGVWRFVLEFYRGDARGTLFPGATLYPSQIWSIVMVLFGVGYIFLQKFLFAKYMKHPERGEQPAVAGAQDNSGEVVSTDVTVSVEENQQPSDDSEKE